MIVIKEAREWVQTITLHAELFCVGNFFYQAKSLSAPPKIAYLSHIIIYTVIEEIWYTVMCKCKVKAWVKVKIRRNADTKDKVNER